MGVNPGPICSLVRKEDSLFPIPHAGRLQAHSRPRAREGTTARFHANTAFAGAGVVLPQDRIQRIFMGQIFSGGEPDGALKKGRAARSGHGGGCSCMAMPRPRTHLRGSRQGAEGDRAGLLEPPDLAEGEPAAEAAALGRDDGRDDPRKRGRLPKEVERAREVVAASDHRGSAPGRDGSDGEADS